MVRLGITGGIGSGKSHVCHILRDDFGLPIYDSDVRARTVTHTDPEVCRQLSELVEGAYTPEGVLDKRCLGDYLFASEENARKVNAVIHPAVRRDLHEWYAEQRDVPVVGVESAILYESGFDQEVDFVLLVDAPEELRIQRTMKRDGLTREQVERRLARQRPEEVRQLAHFIVMNDGKEDLHTQLNDIITQIKERKLC